MFRKKLVMCNLREAFALFKQRYPLLKIGFSKFCELRPKYCVLAGASFCMYNTPKRETYDYAL